MSLRIAFHPLEEALGFKSLLELGEPAYTIAIIASRALSQGGRKHLLLPQPQHDGILSATFRLWNTSVGFGVLHRNKGVVT